MLPAFNERPKIQSKKSGTAHKSKKHQNEKHYKLQYNDHLLKLKESTDTGRLCKECFPKIEWKLKFGKYKALTQPGKCNLCELKTVVKAYRHICDKCCDEKKVCSKCGVTTAEGYHTESTVKKSPNELSKDENLFRAMMPKLQERSRRKVMRLRMEEICELRDGKFWNKEKDREVSCLKWRKEGKDSDDEGEEEDDSEGDDDDDDDFEDDSDDSEDQKKKKPVAKGKK